MKTFQKIIGHTKTIFIHKYYVFKYMARIGMPIEGLMHDMSKFSPVEFCESVKFYTGTHSPIDEAKKTQGFSKAWLHHRGRNPHHYEYWIDYLDDGGEGQLIPARYAFEMVCDYIAAGKAYAKDKWTITTPYNYWMEKKYYRAKIDERLKSFFFAVFRRIATEGLESVMKKEVLLQLYEIHVEKKN